MIKQSDKESILAEIANAEYEIKEARRQLTEAKKAWTAAETQLISSQLTLEKQQDNLRRWNDLFVSEENIDHRKEINDFSNKFPELIDFAKKRDGLDK